MIPLLMSGSRNTEVDGTTNQITRAYDGTTLNTDANMGKIFSPLKDLSALFTAAIRRLKAKSEQKTNDEGRDENITGLYYLLVSFSHHPDAAIKNAAVSLLEIFEHYGLEMKEESFTRESSLVNSLLGDLAKPKALTNITLVPQCAEYIAALQDAQDVFEASRIGFEAAQGEEGTLENATALKKEVVETINKKLVPYLNVMAQLDDTTYGNFARTVAEMIAENNEQVKKRRKKPEPVE